MFPFLKEVPIGRPQAGPKQPQHTRPPLPSYFPCGFALFCVLWEPSIQQNSEMASREPAPGGFGVSGFAAGAVGAEVGWRCSGAARTRTAAEGPPAPLPPEQGGVPAACLLLPDGLGEGGFQRSSSQGHICCMCLKQLIKVPERPKK